MTDRLSINQVTSNDLDQLYDQLEALRAVARDYCPACGRGDAAPTVTDWEQQKERATRAETALARIAAAITQLRSVHDHGDGQPQTNRERGILHALDHITAALEQPRTTVDNPATSKEAL